VLLIGDIHINSRFQEPILEALEKFFEKHENEKNIVFLWDFVYHFAYDRTALLSLYKLFVRLFQEGKSVYVLAGNHDRLGQHFVYEEAQRAFALINTMNIKSWKLVFITEPKVCGIEGKKFLFFPYMLEPKKYIKDEDKLKKNIHKNLELSAVLKHLEFQLEDRKTKHEELSRSMNLLLLEYLAKHPQVEVFHHHYFNKIIFPGQKSRFGYKDIALCEKFLDLKTTKFISGHIHQMFAYQNYVCLGSVRSTSSLEVNQNKCLAQYHITEDKLTFWETCINPYLRIDLHRGENPLIEQKNVKVDQNTLDDIKKTILEVTEKNLISSQRDIKFVAQKNYPLHKTTVELIVPEINYEYIDQYIDPKLRKQCKDSKLKKQNNITKHLEELDVASKNLSTGFDDWKSILKTYLQNKYQDESGKYILLLQELKVL